jgi:hypothetical protein
MLLGTAKAVITPPVGTPLAGFGHRDHGSESVLDDLEVRALWFEPEGAPQEAACIIAADIIGFDAETSAYLCDEIARTHDISPERIMLSASHTHSGPQTCANMLGVGQLIPDVLHMIRERILQAVAESRRDLQPVRLQAGRGKCEGYAISRRLVKDGKALFAPSPAGVRDDDVTVITCRHSASSELRAVLFHYTCHPTTMGAYSITAEYPGMARRVIEQSLPGDAIAAFLPGCFGDVRPNCTFIGGKKFRSGQAEDIREFGTALGNAVLKVIQDGQLKQVKPGITACKLVLELPLSRHPTQQELQTFAATGNSLEKEWSALLLAQTESLNPTLMLQRLDLGENLSLIALGGEVVCDYGWYIRRYDTGRFMIPLAYSNGLTAYIPSAHMFKEGGYEVEDSTLDYGLPSPFTPQIESLIQAAIQELMQPR